MTENTQAREYAEDVRDSLTELWAEIDSPDSEDHEDAYGELEERPLEVVYRAGAAFRVVLTVGGPYAAIVQDGPEEPYLEVFWGSDSAKLYGESITRTADYFREMYEAE